MKKTCLVFLLSATVSLFGLRSPAQSPAKPAEPLVAPSALPGLSPIVKKARAVGKIRDPFGNPDSVSLRFEPRFSDERRAKAERHLVALFGKSLQSVIRAKDPRKGLILFDGKSFRVTEQLFLGSGVSPQPLLPAARVYLTKIESEVLELTLLSADSPRGEETVRIPLDRRFID